jgi:hypothetical protein
MIRFHVLKAAVRRRELHLHAPPFRGVGFRRRTKTQRGSR